MMSSGDLHKPFPAPQTGAGQLASLGDEQPQLACETILEHASEAFDAAFGPRAASSNEGDAELLEGTTELGGLAFSGELFFDGPVGQRRRVLRAKKASTANPATQTQGD
jgi:hypothetical protein